MIFGACSGGALSAGDSATAGAWDELQGAWEGRVAVCRDRRPAAVVSRLAVPAFARHPSPPPSVVLSMTHVSAVDCYAVIAAFYPFIHYLPFYWNVAFTNFDVRGYVKNLIPTTVKVYIEQSVRCVLTVNLNKITFRIDIWHADSS